jgi:hypothetical protein
MRAVAISPEWFAVRQLTVVSVCVIVLVLAGVVSLFSSQVRGAEAAAGATGGGGTKLHALEQIRGFSIQLSDPQGRDNYLKAIDDLADMGCTWVNLVVAARQADKKAESISINWQNIPSEKDIVRILRHAKARGMNVMLMPIVLLDKAGSKDWRGVIAPASWDNWFASYTMYIKFMAKLAKSCNVDVFCVGSELLSTEPFRQRWIDVIAGIRAIFPGKLTYSANWDHYDGARGGPTFWDQLDYIGMNNYNELADHPGATLPELEKAWEPIKRDILTFVDQQRKPFFFTEVGWHNLDNTIKEPWNYVADGAVDPKEQLHAYQSFVATWANVPHSKFMGAFVWEWRPGSKPEDHGTYSLQGEPALDVVKKWMTTR